MITEKLQVPTPTKKEYKEVVQCMLDNGNVWALEDKDILEHLWDEYKENTIICLNYYGKNEITYGYKSETDHTTYTTQEFLNKYGKKEDVFLTKYLLEDAIKRLYGPIEKEELEDNNKTMNMKKFVKTLTLSKEDKLLREYNLQNDCGDFTEEAKELVINKLVEENKAYLVEIATKLKEDKE